MYRFMSKAEIYDLEHPPTPVPTPKLVAKATTPSPHWMWDPSRKTPLDKDAYNRNYSMSPYSRPYYYYNGRYATPVPAR
jgi:hypothetical protein